MMLIKRRTLATFDCRPAVDGLTSHRVDQYVVDNVVRHPIVANVCVSTFKPTRIVLLEKETYRVELCVHTVSAVIQQLSAP